jgi:hypothetical protein
VLLKLTVNMLSPKILSALILLLQLFAIDASPSSYSYTPPYQFGNVGKTDKLAAEGLKKLAAYEAKYRPRNKCTVHNAVKRKEW